MAVHIVKEDDNIVYKISGVVDLYTEKAIRKEILNSLPKDYESVILDMEETKNIDSAGIGMLIYLNNYFKKDGRNFALRSIQHSLMKVFQRGLFEKLFKIL
ncbi:MAG: STAS domain-containing protein [Spirochaetales bacterium]|nr:STAS domain-containing protein [Spirochaetales bacterium]